MMHARHFLLSMMMLLATMAQAQCRIPNAAFQPGEKLEYSLYFNWKFIWVGAGTATMTTASSTWEGEKAYKSMLLTKTSKKLDGFFMMRDTLESFITEDVVPLYYKKAANEGGKLYIDQVWYSYEGGKTKLKQQYQNRRGEISKYQYESDKCIYDMMSMMQRARSLDPAAIKKGDKLHFPMASGNKVEDITLIYRGKENFRMRNTGETYRCLIFSFVEYEDKKEKEIITFYISDDTNHIPVRLDLNLRFGKAKAFLSNASGLKYESASIVKK